MKNAEAIVESEDQSRPSAPREDQKPPQHIIDLAVEVSGWSPCRSKRGVVVFSEGNVISIGHNYKPRGFECDGSEACKTTCRREAVHAEQSALMAAGSRAHASELIHVKTIEGKLVASGGPSCVECSKLARAAGIAWVWLYHEDGWRRYDGKEFHALSLAALSRPAPPRETPQQPIVLRPSSLGGVGVFTTMSLAEGTRVDLFAGKDWTLVHRPLETLPEELQHYCVITTGGYYRPKDFRAMSIGWYLNHSDTPNLEHCDTDEWFTTRPIAAGEELTVDYKTLDAHEDNSLEQFPQLVSPAAPPREELQVGQIPRNGLMERARLQREVAATCGCGEAAQVISDLMQVLESPREELRTLVEKLPRYAFDQGGSIYGPVDVGDGTFVRHEDLEAALSASQKEPK